MAIDIYMQERCSQCADIQYKIKEYNIEYDLHFVPPEDPVIDALEYPITKPVVIDEQRAPNGIVGHKYLDRYKNF